MKKLLTVLVLAMCLALGGLVACGKSADDKDKDPVTPTEYTVAFEVDGARYATKKVKAGEKLAEGSVEDPTKTGFDFDYWTLKGGDAEVDIYDYTVNANVTFSAHFTEKAEDPIDETLNVNDVKDAEKTYYLVIGWWETTGTNEDGSPKQTSYLTENDVRLIYANVILYLQAKGATQEEIALISVRNYSTDTVGEMGEKVNADGDVDIMIGVGNNVNSTAGLSLYENSNDNKFTTPMGSTGTPRYVALLSSTRDLGVNVFDWFRTDVGKKALIQAVESSDITVVPERSEAIDLTVTVHGDTDAVTELKDSTTIITIPNITIADDKEFKGWATTEDGEVALNKAIDAELTYDNVKSLINVGDTTLELFPVIGDKVEKAERVNYVVVAWYDKEATSGLNATIAGEIETALKAYLISEGVDQTDVNTVLFRAYTGNVGPSTTGIVNDNDVDIMLGWGSNISTTGNIPANSVIEVIANYTMGTKADRYLHVLSSDESVVKAMEFFRTADLENFKAPVAAE